SSSAWSSAPTAITPPCTSTTALTKSPNCCPAILRNSSRVIGALTICIGMRGDDSTPPMPCSFRALAVRPSSHRVRLPADEARPRKHAGIDGGARPLALEHGGDLAAEAAPRLGGHARGGRGDVRRDDDVVHVEERVHRIHRLLLEDVEGGP